MNYWQAERLLASARYEELGKPVANNTRLYRRGPTTIALRLHETDVLTFESDGRITFRTGGWQTFTMKDRLNQQGVIMIFQEGWEWYYWRTADPERERHPFVDGMALDADGFVYKQVAA